MTWNGGERPGCLRKWHSAPSRNWPGGCWSQGAGIGSALRLGHWGRSLRQRPQPAAVAGSGETFPTCWPSGATRSCGQRRTRDGDRCGRTGWRLGWRNPAGCGAARAIGAKGPRVYDWARVEIRPLKEPGKGYWLLVRRSIAEPGELAYYVCFGPVDTTLEELVRVAGTRWTIEECFKEAKGEVGLDQYEVRNMGWLVPAHHPGDAGPRLPGGGQAPGVGTRRSEGKGGSPSLDEKPDTPDGARGPAVALPADMETSTYGRISAAVVPVETAAPGNGPALPLPTPPETPHRHFCNCSTKSPTVPNLADA